VSVLDILFFPDAQLRRTATAVPEVDGPVATLVDSMLETMYAAPGIGLAATQVNVHKRVVVIDVSEENDQPITLINPQILKAEEAVCGLSVGSQTQPNSQADGKVDPRWSGYGRFARAPRSHIITL